MKRFAAPVIWVGLLVLLAGMTCRLLWLASQTETGLQTLEQQWADATMGLVLGSRTPVHSREPVEQAQFWLEEVDRVTDAHSDNAELAVGAALVLDSPGIGFIRKYMKKIETIPGLTPSPSLDEEGIKQAEDAFESRCKEPCLDLLARATQLDPANVEWWRLRALLLWRNSVFSSDESPRDPNWAEILEECARHDPDNALYDYLAAYFYWEASAEMDLIGMDFQLVVKDAEPFQRGIRCFEQGQPKPFFAVGDEGFSATAKFLSDAKIPITEQEPIVNSRGIHLRRSLLLRGVWRWQGLRADAKATAGDFSAAIAMKRQNLRLIDQFTRADVSTAYDDTATACRMTTTAQMSTLANEHQDSVSAAEIEQFNALEKSARLDRKVLEQTSQEMAAGKPQPSPGLTATGSPAAIVSAVMVWLSPSLAIVLLLLGCTSMALSRLSNNRDLPTVGPVGQLLAFVAACVVTVVVFGLAPSRIISREIQAWAFTFLVIITPVVLLSWVARSWLRRRDFKFSLRAMLVSMSALCVLFGLVSITRLNSVAFTTMPFELSIPARGWDGIDASILENVMRPLGNWLWALIQWAAYYGQYLTVAIWAGFIAILLRLKAQRAQHRTGGNPLTLRDSLAALCRSLSRPALALSALTLAIYLAIAPNFIKTAERDFQHKMAFARQPTDHWTKVHTVAEKVRSDEAMMARLRETVIAEIAAEAESRQ